MIFMAESMDEKCMNFILNVGNTCYFYGKLNKVKRVETIYVKVSFKNNLTHEMLRSHFKVIFHISSI